MLFHLYKFQNDTPEEEENYVFHRNTVNEPTLQISK